MGVFSSGVGGKHKVNTSLGWPAAPDPGININKELTECNYIIIMMVH